MPSYLEVCIQACRGRGIVLDTNVFILFLIGCCDPQLIDSGDIKRLKSRAYSEADFYLLVGLLSFFETQVVTPGIVTETCNLLENDNQRYNRIVFQSLAQILGTISESQKSLKLLSAHPAFSHFGLADTSVADLANRGYLIITDDLSLLGFMENLGCHVLSFTRIRTESWLSA